NLEALEDSAVLLTVASCSVRDFRRSVTRATGLGDAGKFRFSPRWDVPRGGSTAVSRTRLCRPAQPMGGRRAKIAARRPCRTAAAETGVPLVARQPRQ